MHIGILKIFTTKNGVTALKQQIFHRLVCQNWIPLIGVTSENPQNWPQKALMTLRCHVHVLIHMYMVYVTFFSIIKDSEKDKFSLPSWLFWWWCPWHVRWLLWVWPMRRMEWPLVQGCSWQAHQTLAEEKKAMGRYGVTLTFAELFTIIQKYLSIRNEGVSIKKKIMYYTQYTLK